MRSLFSLRLFLVLFGFLCGQAITLAHDIPRTQIELQVGPSGADAIITFSVKGFVLEYPALQLEGTLFTNAVDVHTLAMQAAIAERLLLKADGLPLTVPTNSSSEFLADRKAIRMTRHYSWKKLPEQLELETKSLFPVDPNHTVFISLYEVQTHNLLSESVLNHTQSIFFYRLGSSQSLLSVVRQFVREGIHHIFIGPDHILFIVGLLLLGGSLRQLLKIVTAFTVAHSITLVLATLSILSPSPKLIEPIIALSIVFVGIQGLIHLSSEEKKHDLRLPLAFCFGLIHGFGFASVLRELELPRAALGWSLFSFNIGVELGQGCIVLAITPLLALLTQRNPKLAKRLVIVGLFGVVLAGAYWFGQRL